MDGFIGNCQQNNRMDVVYELGCIHPYVDSDECVFGRDVPIQCRFYFDNFEYDNWNSRSVVVLRKILKQKVVIICFMFYLMSFFLVATGLHSIDIHQNMIRLTYFNVMNAIKNYVQYGAPLTAITWDKDMTVFGNEQDVVGIYMSGIIFIIFGAIFNFLAFFMLLEIRMGSWFQGIKKVK